MTRTQPQSTPCITSAHNANGRMAARRQGSRVTGTTVSQRARCNALQVHMLHMLAALHGVMRQGPQCSAGQKPQCSAARAGPLLGLNAANLCLTNHGSWVTAMRPWATDHRATVHGSITWLRLRLWPPPWAMNPMEVKCEVGVDGVEHGVGRRQ